MSESGAMALLIFSAAAAVALIVAWKVYRWKLIGLALVAPFWLAYIAAKHTGIFGGRALHRYRTGSPRITNPDKEMEGRVAVNPARMRGVQHLQNGQHSSAGGMVEAVHKLVVAMAGAGKNQADLNYELQHQLENSPEHIILTDPKTNAPLSRIVYAYARPGDRIFTYSFHPKDQYSSALRLFSDPGELTDLAHMLTDEPEAKDGHWNEKGGELIAAVAQALTEQKGGDPATEITATLNDVRDVIADRVKLEDLKERSPRVANVADVEKEWGFIRSTANRRLTALADLATRRVFAGGPAEAQPDFTRRDGRDIVIVRPHPRSAKRLSRYIYAVLDAVYRAAADGGDAGGPGTKVLIDEAASYMKLANLAEYLDLGRESKVQLTYVLQGTKQLAAKLGEKEAEAIISSTELKVVGATTDGDTAKMISELSAPVTAHYRRPAQAGEVRGELGERERRLIEPNEITSQEEGQFTVQRMSKVWKVEVPKRAYHYAQMAPSRRHRLYGVAAPESYEVPALLEPEGDSEPEADEPRDDGDDDDLIEAPEDDEGGGWIA